MSKTFFDGNSSWYLELFADLEKQLNGKAKSEIHIQRKTAISRFIETGFPTTKEEEWKYTNIREIAEINFRPATVLPAIDDLNEKIGAKSIAGDNAYRVVFINGMFTPDLSILPKTEGEIEIMPLSQAFDQHPLEILSYLTMKHEPEEAGFTDLNTAFVNDGVFVRIPASKMPERPVELIYATYQPDSHLLVQPRTIIVAGSGCQVKIIENYIDFEENISLINAVTSVHLEKQARVDYYRIQNQTTKSYHLGTVKVEQQRDSVFTNYSVSFGAKIARNNITALMGDENIECHLYGLYVGDGKQHIDNHTTIDHANPHCHSNELYKGILGDSARGVFNGKIFVRKDAQKTNAIQSNNCILLSKDATIDSKPQLEIFADDVRCTHGATVGQLDENAYFYLRSRGIDKEKARNLLVYAFASEIKRRARS